MRRYLLAGVLVLAGCSEKTPEATEAAVESRGPNVGVSAAPGLAVNYHYGFRLPVDRILATQEDHASQCEALGPAVCRVAGMNYHVGRDRSVNASLVLRLAPDAARRFGRQAGEIVGKHGGMLIDAGIESDEAGATQAAATADTASRDSESARIQQQLTAPGLKAEERTTLQARLTELADANRASAQVARDAAVRLASTPMTIDYQSGEVDLSLADGPVLGAVKDGWTNIVAGFSTIVLIVITLIPWVLAAGLLGWAGHRVNRWLARRMQRAE
jgi:hypothetical protein